MISQVTKRQFTLNKEYMLSRTLTHFTILVEIYITQFTNLTQSTCLMFSSSFSFSADILGKKCLSLDQKSWPQPDCTLGLQWVDSEQRNMHHLAHNINVTIYFLSESLLMFKYGIISSSLCDARWT